MRDRVRVVLSFVPVLLVVACADDEARLVSAVDRILATDASLPGVAVWVHQGDAVIEVTRGRVSLADDARPLRADDLFRVASVTKTYVAAAAFRLHADGRLDLDDPVAEHLLPASVTALRDGGYDPDVITVRQLLHHTAGMFDYTEAPSFYATIDADPSHRWTRAEQLALAMDEGAPLAQPGAAYAYGDTHYILAAEVLETVTGKDLPGALRDALPGAALGEVFFESLEAPPTEDALDRLSHPYVGDEDTRGWDPSWDLYGGGGLVGGVGDLGRFFDALIAGDVLPESAQRELLDVPQVAVGAYFGIDGGPGVNRFSLDDGTACWGGYGYFGTEVVACPDLDLTWAAAINQAEPRRPDAVSNRVLGIFAP